MTNAQILTSLFLGGLTDRDRTLLILKCWPRGCETNIKDATTIIRKQVADLAPDVIAAWIDDIVNKGAHPLLDEPWKRNPVICISTRLAA
jgi:hypothetical protein